MPWVNVLPLKDKGISFEYLIHGEFQLMVFWFYKARFFPCYIEKLQHGLQDSMSFWEEIYRDLGLKLQL